MYGVLYLPVTHFERNRENESCMGLQLVRLLFNQSS